MARVRILGMVIALGAGVLVGSPPASAFDVQLDVEASRSTRSALRNASRLIAAKRDKITDPQDILTTARTDYRQLVGALYKRGYYSGVVHIYIDGKEAANLPPFTTLSGVENVRITVETGPEFKFGQANVGPLAPDTDIPRSFATGQVARSGAVGDAARAATNGWREASHAKARIAEQSVIADHAKATLDANLKVDPGPEVRFGQFVPTGNRKVRTERVLAIAGLPSGRKFRPVDVEKTARRLRRTGAFKSVVVKEADQLGPDNTMDILATLNEEKPRRFGFGVEVASSEGLNLDGYFIHRNLFGGAERLRLDLKFSGIGGDSGGIDSTVSALYSRPATFWTDSTLYVLGSVKVLDEPNYYSKQAELGTGLDVIVNEFVEASFGIAYRYSDVRDDLGRRSFSHITFPLNGEWDKRDDELNARKGFYLQAETMPFIGLQGSASGLRLKADGRIYRTLGGEDSRFVAAGRLQFGSILGASLAGTPPDLLFYSGGGGTVRGQPYQSLNVDLGGGRETGGRSFLGASTELRTRITDTFSVVGFADIGVIDGNSLPSGNSEMHAGAGLGIRYNTAIGPIRLDVATPVAGSTGDGVQLYVGIGQAF